MRTGDVLGGRFELERAVAAGGMGTVWRARDLAAGGAPAAVKFVHERAALDRFAREAAVLASLGHPSIVCSLGRGETESGEPWLAMEWLEGEDLAARIARGGSTPREAITIALGTAAALAAAHACGVVHRDVKPANIFLCGRDPERVKLLDFGIARATAFERLTATGTLMGTPGYMAPEQARGAADIDASADVYSLGCVLFECLAGRPAFVGAHALAIAAKVLLEEPPRLADLAAIEPALDELCWSMMAKDRKQRPASMEAVVTHLRTLAPLVTERGTIPAPQPASIGPGEQRGVTVLLCEAGAIPFAPTIASSTDQLLAQLVATHGGRFDALANGAWIVALEDPESAAACGLGVRALLPGRRMAMATGRAALAERVPMGEAIDRAASLFAAGEPGKLRVDEITAALLAERWQVAEGVLVGRRAQTGERLFLGKPTPCVGREAELSLLEGALRACSDDASARAVVVTGDAGAGKSRLCHELLRRAGNDVQIWIGRGEPIGVGAAGLVAQMLRAAAGITDGDRLPQRRAKLAARCGRHEPRVAEFLCELIGAPVPDADSSALLRAARRDAAVLADQVGRAWIDLVQAESEHHTLVLVLEDLHWADAVSVRLADEALRLCAERPLLVLAFGRPEATRRFPGLFAAQHVLLGPLGRRPAERLARALLGPDVPVDKVAALVERAAGNALFLEELARAQIEGSAETPGTVLALLLTRIGRLEPEARRVLRAASVFGDRFSRAGVDALSGRTEMNATGGWLEELVRRDVLVARGADEYAFRHSLVREAAYGSLTDEDRVLGHRLAGEHLEEAGETDGALLAGHFDKGGAPDHARRWLLRAAEQSIEASDYDGALERTARAVALGSKGDELGALRLFEARAHHFRGNRLDQQRAGEDALRLLAAGSDGWAEAANRAAAAAAALGDRDRLVELGEMLLACTGGGPRLPLSRAACALSLIFAGHAELAGRLLRRAEDEQGDDPRTRAMVCVARATEVLHLGDVGGYLAHALSAVAAWEEAGDRRAACNARVDVGYGVLELGDYAEAERVLREALAEAEELRLAGVAATARHNLGFALGRLGRLDEARRVEAEAVEAFRARGDRRMEGASRTYLARILLLACDLDGAESEARAALTLLESLPPLRPAALATLAEVLRTRGQPDQALATAREAAAGVDIEEGETLVRLALARALDESGDRAAARAAIATARDRLLGRAAKIRDPAAREKMLRNDPERVETLALAAAWLE